MKNIISSYKHVTGGVRLLHAQFCNYYYPRHWHDEYAVGIIHKGTGALNLGSGIVTYPENSVVLLSPGTVHTGFNPDRSSFVYSMFYIDRKRVDETLGNNSGTLRFGSTRITSQKLESEIITCAQRAAHAKMHCTVDANITRLLKCLKHVLTEPGGPLHKNINSKIVEARNIIEKNFREHITVSGLAAQVNLSRSHFTREYFRLYGITPHENLVQLRINEAKKLILRGYRAVDAAYEVGFCDQSHLARWLKKAFLITPSEIV